MIVEFSVKNFRSIKDLQTISFVATKLKSNQENYPDVDRNNIVEVAGMRLLKTVGVYGANASGKSNVIKALKYFLLFIMAPEYVNSGYSKIIDPFVFQKDYFEQETFFQIVLLVNDKKYRYGITIKKNENYRLGLKEYKIVSEWLFGFKEESQEKYFTRNGSEVNKESLPNKEDIPDLQHEHNLFLSHAAFFDKGVCYKVMSDLEMKSLEYYMNGIDVTIDFIKNEKVKLLNFLSSFGLNYIDIEVDEILNKHTSRHSNISLFKLNEDGDKIKLNLREKESEGTRKLFDLAGFIISIFNEERTEMILIIDEIDSNFHPSLLIKLIKMFNDPEINKAGAQLLFTSHDTNLLDPSIMRRDQFYFTEKDEQEATRLYSLADLKGIRNDADFAKQYLSGYYGAVPVLKDYSLEKEDENG